MHSWQPITTWEEYKCAFKNNNHLVNWEDDAICISLDYAQQNNWKKRMFSINMVIGFMAEDEGLFHAIITHGNSTAMHLFKPTETS